MSNFIALDSTYRDRTLYPLPTEYTVRAQQLEGWFRSARAVRPHPQNPGTQPLDFVSVVEVKHLVTPWSAEIVVLPQLFLDIHSQGINDQYLVNMINGRNRDTRFVLVQDKTLVDQNGDPMWIVWKAHMQQTMRFKRDDELVFRLFTESGVTLQIVDLLPPDDPDPSLQVSALFEVTPFRRDGDYSNHDQSYLALR